MKENINSIISIDNATKEVVKETEEKISSIRDELRDTLTKMENESNEKAKSLCIEEYDKILNKFKKEADEKKKENEDRLQEIERVYLEKKEEIIKKSFDLIMKLGN